MCLGDDHSIWCCHLAALPSHLEHKCWHSSFLTAGCSPLRSRLVVGSGSGGHTSAKIRERERRPTSRDSWSSPSLVRAPFSLPTSSFHPIPSSSFHPPSCYPHPHSHHCRQEPLASRVCVSAVFLLQSPLNSKQVQVECGRSRERERKCSGVVERESACVHLWVCRMSTRGDLAGKYGRKGRRQVGRTSKANQIDTRAGGVTSLCDSQDRMVYEPRGNNRDEKHSTHRAMSCTGGFCMDGLREPSPPPRQPEKKRRRRDVVPRLVRHPLRPAVGKRGDGRETDRLPASPCTPGCHAVAAALSLSLPLVCAVLCWGARVSSLRGRVRACMRVLLCPHSAPCGGGWTTQLFVCGHKPWQPRPELANARDDDDDDSNLTTDDCRHRIAVVRCP